MIPQIGQHVKCVLRTGAMAEGIVKFWENTVQLQSLDGESILIIPHPADDIILIKVLLFDKEKKINKPIIESKTELDLQFKETVALPADNLRNKKLAELKILLLT